MRRRDSGCGEKVLPQARRRQRGVPPSVVPCLTTESGLWQCGQAMTDTIMPAETSTRRTRFNRFNRFNRKNYVARPQPRNDATPLILLEVLFDLLQRRQLYDAPIR